MAAYRLPGHTSRMNRSSLVMDPGVHLFRLRGRRLVQSFGKLGWIGLGNMGSRIAKRLRDAGYPLVVYNRDRSKAEELASQGAELAASPAELAAAADVIFSCLSDGAAIRSVYFGADGVLR